MPEHTAFSGMSGKDEFFPARSGIVQRIVHHYEVTQWETVDYYRLTIGDTLEGRWTLEGSERFFQPVI